MILWIWNDTLHLSIWKPHLSTIYNSWDDANKFAYLSLCHFNRLFPNFSSHLIFTLLPHLTVTLFSTIFLIFWLFFSSLFHTLPSQFIRLFISIFDSFSPSFLFHITVTLLPTILLHFGSSSLHNSTLYSYNSSNLSSLFLILLLSIFFIPNKFVILPLRLSFPFSPCFTCKKNGNYSSSLF